MLFKDILDSKTPALSTEVDVLFTTMLNNQSHTGDLLLTLVNGFYNQEIEGWSNTGQTFSPYTFGQSWEGPSENLHYNFIHDYRKNSLLASHSEYLKKFDWSPDKKDQITELEEFEGKTIQLEMLIYLKIWEADSFIKKWYQFARMLNSEEYDWHFKISESNRDTNSTGKRHDIIRNLVRDRLKDKFPVIHSAIKNAYRTQIRNSVAHSNYSFQSRNIHLNNYIPGDPASSLVFLKFDDWIDLFHDTILIYNCYIGLKNRISKYYASLTDRVEILVTKRSEGNAKEVRHLIYRPEFKDWVW